jgi:phosphatidylserine/phosphatidylglycerophosphate/cardiolipin synthase-like enzyme
MAALTACLALCPKLLGCHSSPTHPVEERCAVKVLVDREQVFPAVLGAIRSAKTEVLLSMYLLGGIEASPGAYDGIGQEIVDALVARQEAGVRVRVLNTRFLEIPDPRSASERGPDDPWFHPVFDYAVRQGLPILQPAPGKGGIDHTKYLVVDGREAIFGGMNLGDAVGSNHDVMVYVAGPAARQLQEGFASGWKDAVLRHGEPQNPVRGDLVTPVKSDVLFEARAARIRAGWGNCQIAMRQGTPKAHDILPLLLTTLSSAQAQDDLFVSMLMLSEQKLVDAIVAAHQRGVRTRVMLDTSTAFYGANCRGSSNAATVAKLSDAGIPVRYYKTAKGQEMHMKVFVLTRRSGERIFGVGSSNWTASDMFHNNEIYGVLSDCPGPAAELTAILERDWQQRSREVTSDELKLYRSPKERQKLNRACSVQMGKRSWAKRAS